MYQFEVRFNNGRWVLTSTGSFGTTHEEPSKERIEAYVDGFMCLRAGRVIFYRPDGGIEREAVYEAHDFQMWGARR